MKNKKLKMIDKLFEYQVAYSIKRGIDISCNLGCAYLFLSLAISAAYGKEIEVEMFARPTVLLGFTLFLLFFRLELYILKGERRLLHITIVFMCCVIGFAFNLIFVNEYFLEGMQLKHFAYGIIGYWCLRMIGNYIYYFINRSKSYLIQAPPSIGKAIQVNSGGGKENRV